jgi:hypothetical protein
MFQTTVPAYFAMLTSQVALLGPPPAQAFNAEVVGTFRPKPLAVSSSLPATDLEGATAASSNSTSGTSIGSTNGREPSSRNHKRHTIPIPKHLNGPLIPVGA